MYFLHGSSGARYSRGALACYTSPGGTNHEMVMCKIQNGGNMRFDAKRWSHNNYDTGTICNGNIFEISKDAFAKPR